MAQRPFKVQFGAPLTTSVPVVVMSMDTGDVVITVEGIGDTTISLTAADKLGADRGSNDPAGEDWACYVDNGTVSGLAAFTQYTWTAVQNGNTQSGTFMTAAESGDDFCFYFASCDNNTRYTNNDGLSPRTVHGAWSQIRAEQNGGNTLPCQGVFFVDDFGYVDLTGVAVNEAVAVDDTGYTGKVMESISAADPYPAASSSAYNYGVAWATAFGLLGNKDQLYIAWGHNEDRQWCHDNMNLMPQWGDHEFYPDIGWEVPRTNVAMLDFWADGKACWDAIMKPLQGSTTGATDVGANHWFVDLGDCRLICGDSITNSDALVGNHANGSETQITTLFGANQITDLVGWANSAHAFKVFGLQHSIKYMSVGFTTNAENGRGGQHPIFDHCPTEYASLITNGILNQANSNGTDGTLFFCHGDYHKGHVYEWEQTEGTFYSVGVGTTNGSVNFNTTLSAGDSYTDSGITGTVEYVQAENDAGGHEYHMLRVDVYGSRSPKEMHVTLWSGDAGTVWTKKFINGVLMNTAIEVEDYIGGGPRGHG